MSTDHTPQYDALKSAMSSLLDQAHQILSFPTTATPGDPAPASRTLTYNITTNLFAHLDTDWQILPTLTLTSATLYLAAELSSTSSNNSLTAELSATATVGDYVVTVTGTIPELRANADTEFTLALSVRSATDDATPLDIARAVVGGSSDLPIEGLEEVATALDDPSTTQWALGVFVTVVRSAGGAGYWMKSIRVSVNARMQWRPVGNLLVRDGAVEVVAKRERDQEALSWEAGIAGRMVLEGVEAAVKVAFEVAAGGGGKAEVKVRTEGSMGLSTKELVERIVGKNDVVDTGAASMEVPPVIPSLQDCLEGIDPAVEAIITIEKGRMEGAGWGLKSIKVRAELTDFDWSIVDGLKVRDIAFALDLAKSRAQQLQPAQQPAQEQGQSRESWGFTGTLGATLILSWGQFVVPIILSYDSLTETITMKGTVAERSYGQLSAIAADTSLLTILPTDPAERRRFLSGETEYKEPLLESATAHPAPSASPVSLSSVTSPIGVSDRHVFLQFRSGTLTRARFAASLRKTWQLTDALALRECGITFDVVSPRDLEKRVISGYVYGSATLGNSTALYAFAAGTKTPDDTVFWVGFSASFVPDAPLGVQPTALIADSQFCSAAAPDSGGWDVASFPAMPEAALGSLNAMVLVRFARDPKVEGVQEADRKTRLDQVKVHLKIDGGWKIWEGMQLTYASMDIFVSRRTAAAAAQGYDWSAKLYGSVASKQDSSYRVEFTAIAKHGEKAEGMDVQISLIKRNEATGEDETAVPSPKALTDTGVMGNVVLDETKIAEKIPENYPIQSNSLTTTTGTNTSLTARARIVKVPNQPFSLETLTFTLLNTHAWIITDSPRIQLTSSSISLTITNPTSPSTRTYAITALGLIDIGTLHQIVGTISFDSASKVALTITTGTPASLLSALVGNGSGDITPADFPESLNDANTSFTLSAQAIKSGSSWSLTSTTLDLTATHEWKLGQYITITAMTLKAEFSRGPGGTEWSRSVTIAGLAAIGNSAPKIKVTVRLQGAELVLVAEDVAAADAAAMAGPGAKMLVDAGPEVPTETGVSDWKARKTKATLTLLRNGAGWSVDKVDVRVQTAAGQQWDIITPTLVLKEVAAAAVVEEIIRQARFSLRVQGTLAVKKSKSRGGIVMADLAALRNRLHFALDMRAAGMAGTVVATLGGCNITELLYMLTAGAVALRLDVGPRLITINLDVGWKKELTGTFRGVCEDWDLTEVMPDLLAMRSPALTLSVIRWGRVTGMLDGWLIFCGVPVSMSYEIPDGPMRIAGVDIRDVINLARYLYRRFRNFENAEAETFRVVRGVGAGAATAAEVVGALVALGASPGIVWGLVLSLFGLGGGRSGSGSGGGGSGGETDDPTTNGNGDEHARWTVGGPGRTSGISSETVALTIYPVTTPPSTPPKKSPRVQIFPAAISKNEEEIKKIPFIEVSPIKGGWSCTYTRPSALGYYYIRVGTSVEDSDDFSCSVIAALSVLDAHNSSLVALGPVTSKRGYAHVFPRDTGNNIRFGHREDSAAFTITMRGVDKQPEVQVPVAVNWLNDSMKLSFDPPAAGNYVLSVKVGGIEIKNSPATMGFISSPDPTFSVAYGEGLGSGHAAEETRFSVIVRDQFNTAIAAPAPPTSEEEDDTPTTTPPFCSAFLYEGSVLEGGEVQLTAINDASTAATKGLVGFKYTRPTKDVYFLRILVGGRPLDMSPITCKTVPATSPQAIPTAATSVLTLPLPPYYAASSTTYMATIEAYDQYGARYYSTTGGLPTDFVVTVQKKGTDSSTKAIVHLVARSDGHYDVPLLFPEPGNWIVTCNVPASATHKVGDPVDTTHEFPVLAPPALTSAVCYGPGLSPGLPGPVTFKIRGVDPAGNTFPIATAQEKAAFEVLLPQNIVGRAPQITATADNQLSVLYPRVVPDTVISVLQNGQHVPGSPFLVATVTAPVQIDPLRSVLSVQSHKPGYLSTILFTAYDSEGRRLYTGGDTVAVVAGSGGPVVSVSDRGDGTYAAQYFADEDEETILKVTVEGVVLPLFKPAVATVTGGMAVIMETKAEIEKAAATAVLGVLKDGKEYRGKLALMSVVGGKTVVMVALDVVLGAEDAAAVRLAMFTVPKTVAVGKYSGKLLIQGLPPRTTLPIFTVVVAEAEVLPPADQFKVEGLPLHVGTATAGGVGGGTFTVSLPATSQFKLKTEKMQFLAAGSDPETPRGLEPRFEYKIDTAVVGDKRIIVKITPLVAGAITLVFRYGRANIPPPGNNGAAWIVYSSDASNTLMHHLPPSSRAPTSRQWNFINQAGIQAKVSDNQRLLTFTKTTAQRTASQWSTAVCLIPGVITTPGYTVVYDLCWVRLLNFTEAKLHTPSGLLDATSLALLFTGPVPTWSTFASGVGFRTVGTSSIRADSVWRRIMFQYEPGAVTVLEDGVMVARVMKGPMIPFDAVHIQMFSAAATAEVEVNIRGLVTMPTAFHSEPEWPGDGKRVEAAFTGGLQKAAWTASDSGSVVKPVFEGGEMRYLVPLDEGVALTAGMTNTSRSTASLSYTMTQYRLRVQVSSGDTRITLFGGATLTFANGAAPTWSMLNTWTAPAQPTYLAMGASQVFTASGSGSKYVVITLARSDKNQISCWEDGKYLFTYKERTGGKEGAFDVRWVVPKRGNVVALSHFRGLVEGLAL